MQEKACGGVRKVGRTGRAPLVKGRPLSHHPFRTLAMPTGGGGASAEGGRGGSAAGQPKGHHFHNYFGENLSDGVGGGSHRPQRQQPLSDVNADLGSALHSNVIRTRHCPVTSTSIAPTPWKPPGSSRHTQRPPSPTPSGLKNSPWQHKLSFLL